MAFTSQDNYPSRMKKPLGILFSAFFLAWTLSAEPVVIDDNALETSLQNKIGEFAEDGKGPTAEALATSLKTVPNTLNLDIPEAGKTDDPNASVYVISSVYLCGKCDKWHLGGTASAWALTEDGLMVSNYHVFANAKGAAMGVCDMNGKVHRVLEILAADKANDIAIFRVDAKGLKPLRVGPTAAIGTEIRVVSHPNRLFFTHTFGRVSRYHQNKATKNRPATVDMSITADYALGSSGAPVLDGEHKVVGMVVSTKPIYYKAETKENLQMVVKNCVPVSAIATMLGGAYQK